MMVATPDTLRLHMGLSEGSKPRAKKSRPASAQADRHGFFLAWFQKWLGAGYNGDMTYARFLGVFLVIPILLLALALRRVWSRRLALSCAVVCALAFAYTSPWDNHAARTKLWTFDPRFAPPSHFILYLPWEEYAFYFAQGILMCLLVAALARRLPPATGERRL
jgi:lycopene cyclase domain-containing protein